MFKPDVQIECPCCKAWFTITESHVLYNEAVVKEQLQLQLEAAPEVEGCENLTPKVILDPEGD